MDSDREIDNVSWVLLDEEVTPTKNHFNNVNANLEGSSIIKMSLKSSNEKLEIQTEEMLLIKQNEVNVMLYDSARKEINEVKTHIKQLENSLKNHQKNQSMLKCYYESLLKIEEDKDSIIKQTREENQILIRENEDLKRRLQLKEEEMKTFCEVTKTLTEKNAAISHKLDDEVKLLKRGLHEISTELLFYKTQIKAYEACREILDETKLQPNASSRENVELEKDLSNCKVVLKQLQYVNESPVNVTGWKNDSETELIHVYTQTINNCVDLPPVNKPDTEKNVSKMKSLERKLADQEKRFKQLLNYVISLLEESDELSVKLQKSGKLILKEKISRQKIEDRFKEKDDSIKQCVELLKISQSEISQLKHYRAELEERLNERENLVKKMRKDTARSKSEAAELRLEMTEKECLPYFNQQGGEELHKLLKKLRRYHKEVADTRERNLLFRIEGENMKKHIMEITIEKRSKDAIIKDLRSNIQYLKKRIQLQDNIIDKTKKHLNKIKQGESVRSDRLYQIFRYKKTDSKLLGQICRTDRWWFCQE